MTATSPPKRISAFLAVHAGAGFGRSIAGRPVALGWSTVELDRAATELAAALAIPVEQFVEAADSVGLGARCRVGHGVLQSGLSLVLLEPATEGRLAASLARAGEGPVVIWLAAANIATVTFRLGRIGVAVSGERGGPFGAERLLLDGPIHGPYRLLIELARTIRA